MFLNQAQAVYETHLIIYSCCIPDPSCLADIALFCIEYQHGNCQGLGIWVYRKLILLALAL